MKSKKNKKSGFTLVELMVVAIIVAILAAVAIPLMSGNKERAAATEGQAGCSTIATAIRMMKVEDGSFAAASGVDVEALPGITSGDLNGTYFDEDSYAISATASNFTITATALGTQGIDGDVAMTVGSDGASSWSGTLLD